MFKTKNNSAKKPNSALPVTAVGGAAPINFRYPENMQQPSKAVMNWATTAGLPAPSNMSGVAHGGGRRRTYRRKGGKRVRTARRRSNRRRHTKRNRRN